MSIGSASGFTAMAGLFQDRFRGRTGSLKPAIILAVALWGFAALIIAITLRGLLK